MPREIIQDYGQLVEFLGRVVEKNIDLDLKISPNSKRKTVTINHDQLASLYYGIRGSSKEIDPGIKERSTKQQAKIEKRRLQGVESFDVWLRGKLKKRLGDVSPGELVLISMSFRNRLILAARTPDAWKQQATDKNLILSETTLDKVKFLYDYSFETSNHPNPISRQLLDPIKFSTDGIVLKVVRDNDEEKRLNHGASIPELFLDVIKTLKYPESETVFTNWLIKQFSSSLEEAGHGIRFLQALVNLTAFLDSSTHRELWKPDTEVPGFDSDILSQPFQGLSNSVEHLCNFVADRYPGSPTLKFLEEIQNLIKIRYAEVYSGAYQHTLITTHEKALTPNPNHLPDLLVPLIDIYSDRNNSTKTARALTRMAESLNVTDVNPLLKEIAHQFPDIEAPFATEAQRRGLLPYPQALAEVLNRLQENPWSDAASIDYAPLIDPATTNLEIYACTGTYAPFTKGHKDLIERLRTYINNLPVEDDRGRKRFQRFILIAPITSVRGLSGYTKDADQIGPTQLRLQSILLQISEFDQKQIFLTTGFQADPADSKDLEGRISDIFYAWLGKIRQDLRSVGRTASFDSAKIYVVGPDEIEWEERGGRHREVAEGYKQRRKILQEQGIVIPRYGWYLTVLRNIEGLKKHTGIDTILLAPDPPIAGSSAAIKEIAETGTTRAVEPAALDFVVRQWSQAAIARRRNNPPETDITSIEEVQQLILDQFVASTTDSYQEFPSTKAV